MMWQTMDTAPLDGTFVDLWTKRRRFPNAHYRKGEWVVLGIYGDGCVHWVPLQDVPTHWMPTPEPPKGKP